MRLLSVVVAFFLAGALAADPPEPFPLPPSAKVSAAPADGGGWILSGELPVAFAQAQAQLAARAAAAGWAHLHTIHLSRNRVLEAWSRGEWELTVMVWRISAGNSGFSYGVTGKAGASGKQGGRGNESV